MDSGANPPLDTYVGFNVSIPLRIFDRNQGEKLRTKIDIDKNKELSEAARAQVFSDVDSAYAQLASNIELLKPYKEKYLQLAKDVRDTMEYSYQHGQAALVDYQGARVTRAGAVVLASRRQAAIYHMSGPMAVARDLVLSHLGPHRMMSKLDWLYGDRARG